MTNGSGLAILDHSYTVCDAYRELDGKKLEIGNFECRLLVT